jgi:outer membrane protein TolC
MNKMMTRRLQVCAAMLAAASMVMSPLYAQAPAQTPAQTQNPPPEPAQTPAASQLPGATPTPAASQPATSAEKAPANPVQAPPMKLSLSPDYSHGRPWFPNVIAPYAPRHILQPVLTNSPRLAQLIQAGKLNLTLEDAISLALENNLDIAVQRYTPWLDQMNLLLARSGANGRLSFDPNVTSTLAEVDATQPIANPLLSGVGVTNITSSLTQHTTTGNFGYTQGFITGTQVQMNFNNSRSSSTTSANVFNPSLQSTLNVTVTQPLLNGFGFVPNERYIIEGKNTVKVGDWAFKLAVVTDVTTAQNDYWNLVYARQDVIVEQKTVDVDTQLYNNDKKELEIGTMAPLDVLTAESQLANDQQALIVAQELQLTDETKLLTDVTKNPLDGVLRDVEIVPTTPIPLTDTVGNPSIEDAVQQAWQDRPELQELALNLKNAGVEVQATRNTLLPSLNLFGEYSTTGLGGVSKETTTIPGGIVPVVAEPILLNGTQVPGEFVGVQQETPSTALVPGGIGDAWDALIHSRFPTFEVGVQLNLPIRNRAAQAANGTAQLNQRQQQLSYQEEKNTIFLAVRNALIAVTQDRAAVKAASTARELAQQTFDDEQKKYQLGSSDSYTVALRSRDLTAAATTELQDQINLVEAIVNLDQAMGRTLEMHNITIADDKTANVTPIPNIPGTPNQ